jgi:Zn-dependent metalloprotease
MNKIFLYLMLFVLFAFQSLAQTNEKQEQWERFKHDYPGQITVQWDEHSGGPKRIMGDNIFLKFGSIDKSNIETATREFILAHQDLLNFQGSELRIDNIAELNNKFIVAYQQFYGKVPLWNVKLKIKIASNGQVLSIKSPLFSDLNISTSPAFDVEKAQQIAESEFGISAEQGLKDGELIIYPFLKSEAPVLCWLVKVINNEVQKGVMVDAHTGKIVFSYDLYRNAEIRGNVDIKTWGFPGQTGGTPDCTEVCQDLTVNVPGFGSDNTNSAGYYSVTVPSSGNYTVTSAFGRTTLLGNQCYRWRRFL